MNLQAVFNRNHAIIEAASCNSNSLLTGKLGLVLYYFTLYQAFEDEVYADRCIELLQEVMDTEEDDPAGLTGVNFANGTAGLGFILALLNKYGLTEIDLAAEFHDMDKGLAETAMHFIINEDRNDYLHGAFGILHYFTMRGDEPIIKSYLSALVEAVCQKVVKEEHGTWFRSFFSDPAEKARIDTGLAHGNTGMLLILLEVLKAVPGEKLKQLTRDGISYLLQYQAPTPVEHSFFPMFINTADKTDRLFSSRMAWCYGDTGILLLLYKAAFQLGEPAWKEKADQLAIQLLARKMEESTMISDSHFCHGSAGLAEIFQCLYRLTNNSMFQDAARFHVSQTVTYLEKELANGYYNGKETDLLNGLPGINLSLLRFICGKELAWSHTLLL
ncbi:MAG: hypothetical protein JNM88_09295 [Chitinophagaceae bacterium]|nr:hypothetical protein [Chitinophagaceae bacterium]